MDARFPFSSPQWAPFRLSDEGKSAAPGAADSGLNEYSWFHCRRICCAPDLDFDGCFRSKDSKTMEFGMKIFDKLFVGRPMDKTCSEQ
jgi:hypothetical protein